MRIVSALAVLVAPATVWACPACAARSGPGLGVLGLVAGMIAVPYAITVVAVRVIRRLDRVDGARLRRAESVAGGFGDPLRVPISNSGDSGT